MTQTSKRSPLAPDGLPATVITLGSSEALQITLADWGATWMGCRITLNDGSQRELLLGGEDLTDPLRQDAYFGAIVGRFANRIANGRYPSANGPVQLDRKPGKRHTLHGGPVGFDRQRWEVRAQGSHHVCFGLLSPDGDQGYPGALDVEVCYRLSPDGEVCIDYQARTDASTPVNLSNHAYFNLDGGKGDILRHRLRLLATNYLPVDADLIPLGTLAGVEATGMDFRSGKEIGQDLLCDDQQRLARGYDHAFLFDRERAPGQPALTLLSGDGRLGMELFTTLPAVHVYSGNYLAGTPARGGGVHCQHAGVALETEWLPDSPNHPEWLQPSCLLQPGEVWRHSTRYRFAEHG
ncbi:galactose-1-epimerase [Paludibacterium yongneupense]|uniref:galactose-1-epimerase n=1 Tax=Paludibacterium yongneupense TaxID=400061 RepID=UPI0003FDFAAB|nr:galactose-1-epimerase [Paludibacterium yongneupense]